MKLNIFTKSKYFWNTAQDFIYHYLPDLRKVSANTVASYRDGLNSFIGFLESEEKIHRKDMCFEHLSESYLKEYQNWLLNIKGNSAKTTNLRLTAIRSFLCYASDEYPDLISLYVSSCDIKDAKTPIKPIEFFEKEQMQAILAAPDPKTGTGRRNQMMLILLYDSGARVAELLDLNLGSIHLQAKVPYVSLHGKGDKYRNVPLMEKTCKHLRRYIREFHESYRQDAPLFYATTHGIQHHLSEDMMEKLIKQCAQKARESGIEMPDSCHCHMIRKTRAMDLYQAGVPLPHIQQLLGHENISTTTGFYAFATLDTLAKAMNKVDQNDGNFEKKWCDPNVVKKLYTL